MLYLTVLYLVSFYSY